MASRASQIKNLNVAKKEVIDFSQTDRLHFPVIQNMVFEEKIYTFAFAQF